MGEDSLDTLRPLVTLSAVVGFVGMKATPKGLSRSAPAFAWSIFMFFLLTFTWPFAAAQRSINSKFIAGNSIFCLANTIFFLLPMTAIATFCTIHLSRWNTILQNMKFLDEHLPPSTEEISARRRRCLWFQIITMIVLLAGEMSTNCLAWPQMWYYSIGETIYHLYAMIILLQYVNVILSIGDRFRHINQLLLKIEKTCNINALTEIVTSDEDGKPWESCNRCERIQRLQKAHFFLVESCDCVNSIFGIPLLLLLGLTWIEIMIGGYSFLIPSSDFGGESLEAKICLSIYMLRAVLIVISGILCAERTTVEGSNTTRVLYRLQLTREVNKCGTDMKCFLQQTVHMPPSFVCCGIFVINMKFLFAFLTSVVCYLFIIVEFDSK